MLRYLRVAVILLLMLSIPALAEDAEVQEILYRIDVDLTNQVVTVYTAQGEGEQAIVRQMICSGGTPGGKDETPCGDFEVKQHYPDERSEWYYIRKYKTYVQYATRFNGPYMFHSLPFAKKDVNSINKVAESKLGQSVSHGCLRLRSEDAKWIALNCPDGTKVHIHQSGNLDEELRTMLLKKSYAKREWDSYGMYRAALSGKGLIGALEQMGY